MVGGGFGGSAIALVEAAAADGVATAVQTTLRNSGFDPPRVFHAVPSPGAHRVS